MTVTQTQMDRNRACDFEAHRRAKSRLRWPMGVLFVALITVGWFVPWFGYFIPLCMLGGLIPAFLRGRTWCDWACARGSFLETAVGAISGGRPVPEFLRRTPFRVAILALLFGGFGINIARFWGDWLALGGFLVTFLSATTVVAIVLGMVFQPRAWCAFCPIGTLSHWAGANAKPLYISEVCNECRLCEKVCPMGLAPWQARAEGVFADGDCIKCGLCVARCPRGALSFDRQQQEAA